MEIASAALTTDDQELIAYARSIVDLMPLAARWTPDEGTQSYDPALFD